MTGLAVWIIVILMIDIGSSLTTIARIMNDEHSRKHGKDWRKDAP